MTHYAYYAPHHAYLAVTEAKDCVYALHDKLLVTEHHTTLDTLIAGLTSQKQSPEKIAAKMPQGGVLFSYRDNKILSHLLSDGIARLQLPMHGWQTRSFASDTEALHEYAEARLAHQAEVQAGVIGRRGAAVGAACGTRPRFFSAHKRQQDFLTLMLSYAHSVSRGDATIGKWLQIIERETSLAYDLVDNIEARLHHRRSTARLSTLPDEAGPREKAAQALVRRWQQQGYAAVLGVVDTSTFDSSLEQEHHFRQEIADAIKRCYGVEAFAYPALPLVEAHVPYKDAPGLAQKLSTKSVVSHGLDKLLAAELESAFWLPPCSKERLPLPYEEALWNLAMVEAPKAWQKSRGRGVAVAVVDTGIDYNHPEIARRFGAVKGRNAYAGSDNPFDDNGHGTHVAGTVAGAKTGVAPDATLYAVKVLGGDGSGSTQTVLLGLEWCLQQKKINIVNMSLGSTTYSNAFERAMKVMHDAGICIVASAGNSGDRIPHYPSSYPGVMSIAAIDRERGRAKFSTMNPENDFSAPGVNIYSSVPGGGYAVYSGTSMASPHVAGGAALVLGASHELSPKGVEDILIKTSAPLGFPGDPDRRAKYGFGLIQTYRAIMEASDHGSTIERTINAVRNRLYHLLRPRA